MRNPSGSTAVQLDQTQIVIRARSLAEIGDLALRVIHRFPAATLLGGLLGALPWALANTALIGWLVWSEWWGGLEDDDTVWQLARYHFLLITLVILQAPIAGSLTTIWIARAVFEPQVNWRSAVADWRKRFWVILWSLGVIRGPLPLMVALGIGWGQPFDSFRELILPLGLLVWAGFLRGRRPFLPEILLLERCPYFSKRPGVITARRRNRALHDPLAAELTARFLVVSVVLLVLAVGLELSLGWAQGVLFGEWKTSLSMNLVIYPLALWLVASLSVLVRFLGYLDSRIRLEGWEVDLAVRAEADRLAGGPESRAAAHPRPPVRGSETRSMGSGGGVPIAAAAGQSGIASVVLVAILGAVAGSLPGQVVAQAPGRSTAVGPLAVTVLDESAVDVASEVGEVEADDDFPLVLPSSSEWYDRESGELIPIELRRRDADAANRASGWDDQPADWNFSLPNWGFGDWSFSPWFRVLGWVLLIVASFGVGALLLFLFNRIEPGGAAGRGARGSDQEDWTANDQTSGRLEQLPAELRLQTLDLRGAVERAMKEGRWDQAILALFGHQLILLDRRGWLRLARGKTNRRYLQESASHSPAGRDILTGTVDAFEASYFGRRPPTPERFGELWRANLALEALARQMQEEAA